AFERPTPAGAISQCIQAAVDAGIARGAIEETIGYVKTHSRPWIDSGLERATDDPYTIASIGDLKIKLRAAEAVLDLAADQIDQAIVQPSEENVAQATLLVAEAKVLTTEIALLASNKLFELSGTRSTLSELNLDRHWRNARTHTLHDPVRWKYHIVGNYYLNNVQPPRHPWS
ncbi:acyl-CoA dehydrogenase family protein, partial [Acinetobacter sp.]|uniref:acyl-CoA dehydrogenase family protein n=1 Tax=Acinetobacter sp. TaxID=472 RepID=UPI000C0B7B85